MSLAAIEEDELVAPIGEGADQPRRGGVGEYRFGDEAPRVIHSLLDQSDRRRDADRGTDEEQGENAPADCQLGVVGHGHVPGLVDQIHVLSFAIMGTYVPGIAAESRLLRFISFLFDCCIIAYI